MIREQERSCSVMVSGLREKLYEFRRERTLEEKKRIEGSKNEVHRQNYQVGLGRTAGTGGDDQSGYILIWRKTMRDSLRRACKLADSELLNRVFIEKKIRNGKI